MFPLEWLIFVLSTDPDIDPIHVIAENTNLWLTLILTTGTIIGGLYGLGKWNKSIQTARYDEMEKKFMIRTDNLQKNIGDQLKHESEKTNIVLEEQNRRFDKFEIVFEKIDAKLDTNKEILIKDTMLLQEHDKRLTNVEHKLDDK